MLGRQKDNPIVLPAAKGKYLNVAGMMTRKNKFYFEVLETTFNSDRIIMFIDRFVEQTVKRTVVILDNSPIDKSKKFMAKIEEWKVKDVLIYFLPPYSPELNLIEILWKRIKYQWLDFDAYKSFKYLKENFNFVLNDFKVKYNIKFLPLLSSKNNIMSLLFFETLA